MSSETLQIVVSRNNTGESWGFRLQGGSDFSTALSLQLVNPGSIAERHGLKAGDGILAINGVNTDGLTHEQAKQEIVRSGNDITFLLQRMAILSFVSCVSQINNRWNWYYKAISEPYHIIFIQDRGAVSVWKPQVTPMGQIRPAEIKTIKTATGDEMQAAQKTSLARQHQEDPQNIGSSHNRSARPFGSGGYGAPKQATPNVVHAQYNTPIGLYSAGNIADTYATQTAGIQDEMGRMDLQHEPVGAVMSGTFQPLSPQADTGAPAFKSVSAPQAKPPGERSQQQQHMRCGECDMLVTGVFVKVKGVPYHAGCFKCTTCGMNLKQRGYFEIEGKLYCETHAKRVAQAPGSNMVATAVYR